MISGLLVLGPDLHPVDEEERDAFLCAAGSLPRETCPAGFRGHSAVWARDNDLLVGQAALVVLTDESLRARLVPRALQGVAVGAIDALAVRAEYRETGLEERMVRRLIRDFARGDEALVFVGAAHAPVLASTLETLDAVDGVLG
ncbi:hypothetical protein [Jannaschia sp. 2305UL9-9]|uniref:hypothetical protein n=1 Tax=Jannaschia sp. 2305UL9-9 TaxID=3121638 RepID=UPI00352708BB